MEHLAVSHRRKILNDLVFSDTQKQYIAQHSNIEPECIKLDVVNSNEEILETRIIGTRLQVTSFGRLPGRVLDSETSNPVRAYLFVFHIANRPVNDPHIWLSFPYATLFLRHRPQVYILYEDQFFPNQPVREYRLRQDQSGLPFLELTNENAETDSTREHDEGYHSE